MPPTEAHGTRGDLNEWFKCSACPRRYKNSQSAGRHYREKHQPSHQKYHCKSCGDNFVRKDGLKLHVRKRCKALQGASQDSGKILTGNMPTASMSYDKPKEFQLPAAAMSYDKPKKVISVRVRLPPTSSYNAYESISKAFDKVADESETEETYEKKADRIAMKMWRKLDLNDGRIPTTGRELKSLFLDSEPITSEHRYSFRIGSKQLTGIESIVLLLSLSCGGQQRWVNEFQSSRMQYAELYQIGSEEPIKSFRTDQQLESILRGFGSENTCILVDHFASSCTSPRSSENPALTMVKPILTLYHPVEEYSRPPDLIEAKDKHIERYSNSGALASLDSFALESSNAPVYPRTHERESVSYIDIGSGLCDLTKASLDPCGDVRKRHTVLERLKSRLASYRKSRSRNGGLGRKARRERRSQVLCLYRSFRGTHEKLAAASASDLPDLVPTTLFDLLGTHAASYRQAKSDGFEAVKALFQGQLPSPRDLRGVLGLAQVASAMRDVLVDSGPSSDSELASLEKFLNDLDRLTHLLDRDLQPAFEYSTLVMWEKQDRAPSNWLDEVADRDDLLLYFQGLFDEFQSVSGMGVSSRDDCSTSASALMAGKSKTYTGTSLESGQFEWSALDLQRRSTATQVMFLATGAIFGLLLAFLILWCK